MYAHKAIDDLNWYCQQLKNKERFKDHIKMVQEVIIPWIMSSQKFNMSAVGGLYDIFAEKYNKCRMFNDELGNVRLPYNTIWLEYDIDNEEIQNNQCGTRHRAVLAKEISADVIQCIIFAEIKTQYMPPKWTFGPVSYYLSMNNKPFEAEYLKSNNIQKNIGTPIYDRNDYTSNIVMCPIMEGITDLQAKTCLKEDGIDIAILNIALMLLGCKNIEREEHKPSRALALSRNKKNKAPLFTYYTLKIKPIGKQQESIPKDLWHNRIHLCRGHFKTYNESNPLFGHITGRFWWQPHVRGQNRDGVVMKDYEITTEPEE